MHSPLPLALRTDAEIEGPAPDGSEGVNPVYIDPIHHTTRLAHRLWGERQLGLIHTHYHPEASVWTGFGPLTGHAAIMALIAHEQGALTDITVTTADMLWAPIGAGGPDNFICSHRQTIEGTHLGYGTLGAPSGRRVRWTGIIDSRVEGGTIREQWRAVDRLAIRERVGRGVPVIGIPKAMEALTPEPAAWRLQKLADLFATPEDADDLVLATLWQQRLLGEASRLYAPGAIMRTVGARSLVGPDSIAAFVGGLLASIPDAVVRQEQLIHATDDPFGEPRTAVRFQIGGTLNGHGLFGTPTGQQVLMTVIEHRIGNPIRRSWLMFDMEAALSVAQGRADPGHV